MQKNKDLEDEMNARESLRHHAVPTISALLLSMLILMLAAPRRVRADSTFNVSATFADNSSTALTGTLTINTATGAVDGFNFDIPTMTIGSTTLAGALFTPSTATESYFTHPGGSEIDFQLFGAPPQGEILFLEIPQTTLVSYTGGLLLQGVNSGGTILHTGYQSGVQSNPFIELTGNGTITPTPEPSCLTLLATGVLGLLGAALKKATA
jgi:hypothetical protein